MGSATLLRGGCPGSTPPVTPVDPVYVSIDIFALRRIISGSSGSSTFFNTNFGMEAGEPNPGGNFGKTGWFQWTAPSTGTVNFNTNSTVDNRDTIFAAYTGNVLASLTLITWDDDSGTGVRSDMSFAVTSGTVYVIQVGTYNGSNEGEITLSWSLT